jgi:hypothetical protein
LEPYLEGDLPVVKVDYDHVAVVLGIVGGEAIVTGARPFVLGHHLHSADVVGLYNERAC